MHHRPRRFHLLRTVFLVAEVGAAVGFAILAITSHSEDARSSFVQRHGIRRTGIVESVQNLSICDRDGLVKRCVPRIDVIARLSTPVRGVRGVRIEAGEVLRLGRRERINVLVDPRDPSYAELRGVPSRRSGGWIALAVLALIFTVVAVAEGRSWAGASIRSRQARRFNRGRPRAR